MKSSLRPGATRVNRILVGRERTIGFMGEEARTYGTPSMILDIEHTCRELIKAKTFERLKAKAARFAAQSG
jgi:fluoroacetyl-CoA thioesterase